MHKTLRVLNFDFITLILQLGLYIALVISLFANNSCYQFLFLVIVIIQQIFMLMTPLNFIAFIIYLFSFFSLRHTDESSSGKSIINTWLLSNILLSLPKWENNKFQNLHHQKEPTSIELLVPWVDNTERVFYYYYFCCKINLWFFLFQI